MIRGPSSLQRNKETRQLSAPKSTATIASVIARKPPAGRRRRGSNDQTCRAPAVRPGTGSHCAIFRIDGPVRKRAPSIEICQHRSQLLIAHRGLEGKVVLCQRRQHPIARKHGRSFDHGRRADTVHSYPRGKRNCHLADQVADRGLADVIGFTAALGDHCIGGTGQHHRGVQSLFGKYFCRFIHQEMVCRNVQLQGRGPLLICDLAIRGGRERLPPC